MRAASSSGVMRPAKAARPWASRSAEKPSLRHVSRSVAAAPALSPCAMSACANAKCPLTVCGGSVAEEADDRLRVDTLFPHHAFGAAAQRRDARPARIGGDEIDIAREIRRAAVAAQDHPFHELLGQRIGNRAFDVGRVVGAVLADKIDRLFDGRDIKRRRRRSCRCRQRQHRPLLTGGGRLERNGARCCRNRNQWYCACG